jgi:MATE family multidrug resistance protein
MMGRYSADALAAGGMAANLAFILVIIPQGLLMALQPILAQLRGAADHSPFARILAGAFALSQLCAVPIILIILQMDKILILVGTEPGLAARALDYEYGFAWGVPAALWQMTCRYYLSAIERPRIILLTIAAACLLNVGLNWVMIFGHLGFPALGMRGSAYATSLSCWAIAIALTVYGLREKLFPGGMMQTALGDLWRSIAEILHVGWAIAGSYIVEVGMFSASAVLMARFGDAPLAAHQICLGISTLTFMVPMAIGQAGTVRVGFHIGAGQPLLARRAGFVALAMGVGFMTLAALGLRIFVDPIVHLYIDANDPLLPEVLRIGRVLIALAALFQIFDGGQAVASGILRGLKDTRAAMVAAIIGYWGIGLPFGVSLAFFLGVGPAGLWWGFVCGLTAASLMQGLRFDRMSRRLISVIPA